MPKRIQRKRTKGWRMPPHTVYVGRPSRWKNPFTGPDAVEQYRKAIFASLPIPYEIEQAWCNAGGSYWMLKQLVDRNELTLKWLRGFDLACWCPLDKPCHADILLEIANRKV